MTSERSKLIRHLSTELKAIAPKLVKSDAINNALQKALSRLTLREREFLSMKMIIRTPHKSIIKCFGWENRKTVNRRWSALLEILKLYLLYFVKVDHPATVKKLTRWCAEDRDLLLDIFDGMNRYDLKRKHKINSGDLQRFLERLHLHLAETKDKDVRLLINTVLVLVQRTRL